MTQHLTAYEQGIQQTADADLDVIRKMAPRYGDDAIARVLNKLGRRTGKGKPWSQTAVKTARRNHSLDGCARSLVDEDVLTMQGAARYTKTSDTTIKKLVDGGILPMHQVVPFAPWEIRRTHLDSERVRAVLVRLKHTGASYWGIRQTPNPNSSHELYGGDLAGVYRVLQGRQPCGLGDGEGEPQDRPPNHRRRSRRRPQDGHS